MFGMKRSNSLKDIFNDGIVVFIFDISEFSSSVVIK